MSADTPRASHRSPIATTAIAGAITFVFMILLHFATGPSLGFFFGGTVLLTILLPPLVLIERGFLRQALLASAVNDAVGLVWLVAVVTPQISFMQWLACYVLLVAYAFALWGLVRALVAIRLHPLLASAASITIALLWLGWPIWLARFIVQGGKDVLVSWLIPPHPLFVLNGVLRHLGIWSEQPIAYRHLLNLGQDVAYQLPEGILTGVFVHVIAGGILFAIGSLGAQHSLSPEGRGLG